MPMLLSAGLVALCVALLPVRAESAPILYSYSGQVSVSTGSSSAAVGSAIAGTFTYDPEAVLDSFFGTFAYFLSTVGALATTVDGITWSSSPVNAAIYDDIPWYGVGGSDPLAMHDVFSFTGYDGPIVHELFLLDADHTVLSTLASLPAVLPLAEFEYAALRLTFEDGGYVEGNIALTPAAAVPEPASMLLVGAGLIGLAVQMRRRSQACSSRNDAGPRRQ